MITKRVIRAGAIGALIGAVLGLIDMAYDEQAAKRTLSGTWEYQTVEIETEPREQTLNIATMVYTPDEAEALLQRFEDEREEIRRAAERKVVHQSDLHMLAVIIGQETAGVNEEVMMAVGNVILNRVADPRFPGSVYGVLTGKNQYGHDNGEGFCFPDYVSSEGRARCYAVASRLLSGERVLPANVVWQAGFAQGAGIYLYYDIPPHGIYLCF